MRIESRMPARIHAASKGEALVLRGGTLVDGTGAAPLADAIVVVLDGRVEGLGTRQAPPPVPGEARSFDMVGKWLIPGLINCHDHVFNRAIRNPPPGIPLAAARQKILARPDMYLALASAHNVFQELLEGVTVTRDLGARRGMALQLRDAIADGLAVGPRILAAGEAITTTGGHFHLVSRQADGVEEVRKAVREQVAAGADCIKLMASGGLTAYPHEQPTQVQYTVEELRAAVEEAHRSGRLVTAHAQATQGIRNAVEAGVDAIEHGWFLDGPTLKLMRQRGVHMVPTLSALAAAIRGLRTAGEAETADYLVRDVQPKHCDSVKRAASAGIVIAAGTDATGLVSEEMELLVDLGFSPEQALQAATRDAALVCGIEQEAGIIGPGRPADLVILRRDPLGDVGAVKEVAGVVRGGVVFMAAG